MRLSHPESQTFPAGAHTAALSSELLWAVVRKLARKVLGPGCVCGVSGRDLEFPKESPSPVLTSYTLSNTSKSLDLQRI